MWLTRRPYDIFNTSLTRRINKILYIIFVEGYKILTERISEEIVVKEMQEADEK